MAESINSKLYDRALKSIAGGVNSPARAFKNVDMTPFFAKKAKGAYIYNTQGKKYIDLLMSWGAIILGHCDEDVNHAAVEAVKNGSSFGVCTENETKLAELIKSVFASIELIRMVNSGTEAVMSAIRTARAYTGKNKIIKFEGCYHGHSDEMLSNAGSALATLSIPISKGVAEDAVANVLTARFNNLKSVEDLFSSCGKDIAAVIIEPIAGNMGVIPADYDFLKGIRKICDQNDSLLIFDEVITGFRVALGGAQSICGIKPDITILGKIVGGGFPFAVFGGQKEIMQQLAPLGQAYQAGTLSGNPVAVAAAIAVIEKLLKTQPYKALEANAAHLTQSITKSARQAGLPVQINRSGSMFTIFFSTHPITTYSDLKGMDTNLFKAFFKEVASNGVLMPPSPYESCFISTAHDENVINKLEKAFCLSLSAF